MSMLAKVADRSVDAVMSTLALHHLPSPDLLERCFAQIRRVLRADGRVYLVDLGRLKSLKSVLYFAYMNARHQPHIFSLDYERSLRAAFLPQDFRALTERYLPADTVVYTPFRIPVLILVKSADRPLAGSVQERIRQLRRQLPLRYRRDLDDIRFFFRLNGLRNDPFR